jgi:hypothetical protein
MSTKTDRSVDYRAMAREHLRSSAISDAELADEISWFADRIGVNKAADYKQRILWLSAQLEQSEERQAVLADLLTDLIYNDPDELIADGGVTLLPKWRADALRILKRFRLNTAGRRDLVSETHQSPGMWEFDFTPGPWEADSEGIAIMGCNGQMKVADVRGWGYLTGGGALGLSEDRAIEIQKANATLLAEAPALCMAAVKLREAQVKYLGARNAEPGDYSKSDCEKFGRAVGTAAVELDAVIDRIATRRRTDEDEI